MFTGDQCETKTFKKIVHEVGVKVSTIVAFLMAFFFWFFILAMDYHTFFVEGRLLFGLWKLAKRSKPSKAVKTKKNGSKDQKTKHVVSKFFAINLFSSLSLDEKTKKKPVRDQKPKKLDTNFAKKGQNGTGQVKIIKSIDILKKSGAGVVFGEKRLTVKKSLAFEFSNINETSVSQNHE